MIQDMSSDIYTCVFVSYAILLILFEGRLSGKQGKNADLENLLQCIKSKKMFKPGLKIVILTCNTEVN